MADESDRALWRPMAQADLSHIHILSKQIHPAYPERPEIAREAARPRPARCRVLAAGAELHGYLLGHPWRRGAPPPALIA